MENICTLEVTNDQLILIQQALDMYSRIGIGQLDVIKNHPSFQMSLEEACRPVKTPEVGDRTPQGTIIKIKRGHALITGSIKNGSWNEEHEWKKLKDVRLSVDYSKYHEIRDQVDNVFTDGRNLLWQNFKYGKNGGYGIHSDKVDETCRVAYDLYQVIRHEFWKKNPNRSFSTVDSSLHLTSKNSDLIVCKLDMDIDKVRDLKLKEIGI
jgi:hypothetical protein